MAEQKRILLIRTDRVGDTIMITPMVRELKLAFPDSFVATLTQPSTSAVFDNNPYVDRIITDDLKKESFWDVVRQIRKLKFTHGLLVFPTERAAFQMFYGRVKKRYMTGFRLYSALTFISGVSRNNYIPLRHEADYCMDLARKIGVKTDNIQLEIFVKESEKSENISFLESNGVPMDKFKLFFHTGSGNSAPNWSEARYFELLKGILNKYKDKDFRIILTAFEMTNDFRKKVIFLNDFRVIDLSEKINTLRELICSISNADLLFCSSTGPIHIADALNVKCIGIYCHRPASSSKHWGVLNSKSVNLEVSEEFCDSNCSADKKICQIENGLLPDEVLNYIEIN